MRLRWRFAVEAGRAPGTPLWRFVRLAARGLCLLGIAAGLTGSLDPVRAGEDGLFAPSFEIPAGGGPADLEAGDLEEDGDLDLATLNLYDDNVTVLLGNGDGTFFTGGSTYLDSPEGSMALGDLDGDGHLDLVATNQYPYSVRVLLGNGEGAFTNHWQFSSNYPMSSVALGKTGLDGDGDLDLAVSQPSRDEVIILTGDGDGTFTLDGNFTVGDNPDFVAFTDLDLDSDLDLASANRYQESVTIRRFIDGNFTHRADYSVTFEPDGLAFGDLDGDGDPDLVAVHQYSDRLSILEGYGDGSFGSLDHLTVAENPGAIIVADLDLDGHLDLATANLYSDDVGVLLGNGDLTFDGPYYYGAGDSPSDLASADFDQDGDQDLAVANFNSDDVSILLNRTMGLRFIVTGPGRGEANPPLVRLFDPRATGLPEAEWFAYATPRFGANVAAGDLDHDRHFEVLTGPGPGEVFGPQVRGFRDDGAPIPEISFLAYSTHRFGVNVACGDLDGDGFAEIVSGAGPGAVFGPHVRGWNWDGAGAVTPLAGVSFLAYGTPKWGVNVACGDLDGDGFAEIVTGPGPGAVYGPHVRGWNWDGAGQAAAIPGVSFLAYGTHKFGVNVASGDIDGDGFAEIVTGAGPGVMFGPHVRGWNWDGNGAATAIPGVSFMAYSLYSQWGVHVACGDVDQDGIDEILTGPGPGAAHFPWVKGFNYDGQALTAISEISFLAYDAETFTHGVKVGAVKAGLE